MSSDPPPGLDLSLLIAETQARLASSSTRARTGATAASGVVGPDTFHVSPGPTAVGSVDNSFLTPAAVGGHESGVLGESFSGGGCPIVDGSYFSYLRNDAFYHGAVVFGHCCWTEVLY
jgi:hypothetical protein